MKAIQIVIDERLLGRIDRAAKRKRVSRSAFIRRSLEGTLTQDHIGILLERDRAAYARVPPTPEELEALRDLQKAQDKVLDSLGDRW